MRGVKYNLKFREIDNTHRSYENLLIADMVEKINNCIKEVYNLNLKISHHMIYNLIHRPHKSNEIIKQLCKVEFSNRVIPQLNSQN